MPSHETNSTLALPTTMMPNRARVNATFNRLGSFRNPTPWCSLDLTQDNTMKSFSRPWNASTLATSISCNTHHTPQVTNTYRYTSWQFWHKSIKRKLQAYNKKFFTTSKAFSWLATQWVHLRNAMFSFHLFWYIPFPRQIKFTINTQLSAAESYNISNAILTELFKHIFSCSMLTIHRFVDFCIIRPAWLCLLAIN